MTFSAKILKEQMQVFINFQEQDEPVVEEVVEEEEQWNEHLFSRVEDLELSVRCGAYKCKIEYIYQLVQRSEQNAQDQKLRSQIIERNQRDPV